MEENKKKNKGLIILIVLLIVCVIVLAGFFFYGKEFENSKGNNNTTTITTTIKNDTETLVIDLNKIDMNSKLQSDYKIVEMGDEILTESKEFNLLDSKLKLTLDNDTLNIVFDYVECCSETKDKQTYTNTISGVKKIYYRYYRDNDVFVSLYVLTDNKVYYGIFNHYGKFEDSGIIEYANNSYDSLYESVLYCGIDLPTFIALGRTTDGSYYKLDTGEKIDLNNYYYYEDDGNYVKTNRDYSYNNKKGKYKIGFFDTNADTLSYLIDENNNIYGYTSTFKDGKREFKL